MAVIFTQDIAINTVLPAYNNNVIRFFSDTTSKTVLTANIVLNSKTIVLYPTPTGEFYFNFREYVTAIVNQNRFIDLVNPDLDPLDNTTFVYAGVGFFSDNVLIKINFTDTTNESVNRLLLFNMAVEQLDGYKRNVTQQGSDIILSPLMPNTNNHYYVKYWEGYPFDLSFATLNFPTGNIFLNNLTNLLNYTFPVAGKITRLFFSDGSTDESINDLLPIALGKNEIRFSDRYIIVDKQDVCEGLYIKWLNSYGGYSYWKFDNIFKRTTNTKSLGEVVTDFENLGQTFSQVAELGKTAGEKIAVNTDTLDENELTLLKSLLISPKVYLFVGEPFSRADVTDWVEVKITSQNYTTRNYKGQPVKLAFELELPDLYTQVL